jgi:streptogramin lyase
VHEPPPALAASRPELGGEIDRVLARALAKAPAERQQSCGELIASARAAVGVHGTSTPASPLPRRSPRLGRLRAFLAGAAVVLAAAVALAVALRGDNELTRIGPMSVGVVDPATNELVADIPLGFTSSLMAAGAGLIWVVDPEGNTLTRIDPKTMKIVARPRGIPASVGIPVGLAVGEGSVWVAVNQGRTLEVLEIGPALGDLRQRITLEEARAGPFSVERETVVLAIGAGSVWALERARGEVTRIDPATGVAAPIAEGLDAISLAVGVGSVWLGGRRGVTRLDPETGTELAFAEVPNVSDAQATSIAVGSAAVWFAGSSQPRLSRLTPAGAILDSYPVGAAPSALAVGDDGIVWVASSTGGSVLRLDPETESVETIDLGASPSGIIARYGAVWTGPGEPAR